MSPLDEWVDEALSLPMTTRWTGSRASRPGG
jgi:hypothetical protein